MSECVVPECTLRDAACSHAPLSDTLQKLVMQCAVIVDAP